MNFKELKKALASEAKAAGICEEWHGYILNAPNKERLIALYFGGFDFVEENDFPSEPLRREFDDIRRHYAIYEAERFNAKNPRRLVAYTGAEGTAHFTGFAVAQVWARKGAQVTIGADDRSCVTLDVAQGAAAHIKATGKSSVIVFNHGGTVTQEATDNAVITIKDKQQWQQNRI